MWIINFSHPLTEEQRAQIEALTGTTIERVVDVPCQFDPALPFADQIETLVENVGLRPEEWENVPILISPPGFSPIACCLIAELHGRMGYFPPLIRLRPILNSVPTRFEVAEIINLQQLRERGRRRSYRGMAGGT